MGVTVEQEIDSQITWLRNNGLTANLIELTQKAYEDLRNDTQFMALPGTDLRKYRGIPLAVSYMAVRVVVHAYNAYNPVWAPKDAIIARIPLSKLEERAYKLLAEDLKNEAEELSERVKNETI